MKTTNILVIGIAMLVICCGIVSLQAVNYGTDAVGSEAVSADIGDPDIEASITNIWGSSHPIKLFGQDATLGQVVAVNLDFTADTPYFRDPLPTYTTCPGWGPEYYRNADKSVISRISTFGPSWQCTIVADICGGTGYMPGSEGYIQLTNPEWKITNVYSGSVILTEGGGYSYGDGISIDKQKGRIEWSGRGGCPACACHENEVKITFVVEKNPAPFVTVSTDKASYTTGETMQTSIHLENPSSENKSFVFTWYFGIPSTDSWTTIMSLPVTLPPDYNETFTIPIPVGDWGSSFDGVWTIGATNPTSIIRLHSQYDGKGFYNIISDSTEWSYVATAMGEEETALEDIAEETKKIIERVELPS